MRHPEITLVLASIVACTSDIDFPARDRDDDGEPGDSGPSSTSTTSGPPTPGPCDPDNVFLGADDACARDEYCYRTHTTYECLQAEDCPTACAKAAPCPGDGMCDPGALGSICNDDLFPQKDRTCYLGCCRTPANCPPGFDCVGTLDRGGVGLCSNGAAFMPCASDTDCKNGSCVLFGPVGVCLL